MKEIEREFGKGKKVEEDIWKGMDGFWDAVKEKEVEKKEMPIVMAMTPKRQTARRGDKSSFWTR